MNELTMDRLRENLESLKMKNTLEILDNYLERAVAEKLNIIDVLDHIFSEEAKCKRRRAYEKQIQMSGFPIKKTLEEFDFSFQPSIDKRQIDELATMRFLENGENVVFLGPPGVGKTHLASALGIVAAKHRFSTYYVNCHQLIEQLKKAHFENRLPDRLKILSKYRMLIIDEISYLPMDIQGANLFFQLIARRYEKASTVFTSNKTFSQWNEVFADVTIASAILDQYRRPYIPRKSNPAQTRSSKYPPKIHRFFPPASHKGYLPGSKKDGSLPLFRKTGNTNIPK